VSNWVDDAKLRSGRYTGFPEYIKNGSVYLVNMPTADGFAIWAVPERQWEFVKKIWPVFAKRKPDGSYFVAKQIAGQTIPVHRLILSVEPGDTVQSKSNNLLDWSSLYVRPFNRSGIYDGRRMGWNKEANRPNTVQEEFESRFKPLPTVETTADERASGPSYSTPANADLAAKTTCWGSVVGTGWVEPITTNERDLQDATERYPRRVRQSPRLEAAAKALDDLGL
jgi:hypothetical protein